MNHVSLLKQSIFGHLFSALIRSADLLSHICLVSNVCRLYASCKYHFAGVKQNVMVMDEGHSDQYLLTSKGYGQLGHYLGHHELTFKNFDYVRQIVTRRRLMFSLWLTVTCVST